MPIVAATRISAAASGSRSIADHSNGSIAQTIRLLGVVVHWDRSELD